jgi:hypothetical protein
VASPKDHKRKLDSGESEREESSTPVTKRSSVVSDTSGGEPATIAAKASPLGTATEPGSQNDVTEPKSGPFSGGFGSTTTVSGSFGSAQGFAAASSGFGGAGSGCFGSGLSFGSASAWNQAKAGTPAPASLGFGSASSFTAALTGSKSTTPPAPSPKSDSDSDSGVSAVWMCLHHVVVTCGLGSIV